jgi:Undecaprenyl-phosphate galactose phosphotransferase WbaP
LKAQPLAYAEADIFRPSSSVLHQYQTGRLQKSGNAIVSILALLATDVVALAISVTLSVGLWRLLGYPVDPGYYLLHWWLIFVVVSGYVASGMYQEIRQHPVEELRVAAKSTTVAFLALTAGAFLLKQTEPYSRTISMLSWFLSVILIPLARIFIRNQFGTSHWWGQGVVVFGAGQTGTKVIELLQKKPSIGLKPLLILDEDTSMPGSIGDVPVFNNLEMAPMAAKSLGVRCAIIAASSISREKLLHILQKYGNAFSRIIVVSDLLGSSSLWVEAMDLGGILGLKLRQNLLDPWSQATKRVLEMILTVVCLIMMAPIIVVICAVIKLTSPGPILFSQVRQGKGGRQFIVRKFRTMAVNAEEVLQKHLEAHPFELAQWKEMQKLPNDPRVTGIGRFLRWSSLDELPQLLNVLRGDMALVGPRPIVKDEIFRYALTYERYCAVKPGLTGLWQVSGRNNLPYEERVRLDEYYVRNWSVWLDIYILAKTMKTVLKGEGAY